MPMCMPACVHACAYVRACVLAYCNKNKNDVDYMSNIGKVHHHYCNHVTTSEITAYNNQILKKMIVMINQSGPDYIHLV